MSTVQRDYSENDRGDNLLNEVKERTQWVTAVLRGQPMVILIVQVVAVGGSCMLPISVFLDLPSLEWSEPQGLGGDLYPIQVPQRHPKWTSSFLLKSKRRGKKLLHNLTHLAMHLLKILD